MSEPSLSMRFESVGPTICAPDTGMGTRADPAWLDAWEGILADNVSEHDPWGLLAMRPDADVMLFDVTAAGVRRCAEWAVEVRLLQPIRPKVWTPCDCGDDTPVEVWSMPHRFTNSIPSQTVEHAL